MVTKTPLLTKEVWQPLRLTEWFSLATEIISILSPIKLNVGVVTKTPLLTKEGRQPLRLTGWFSPANQTRIEFYPRPSPLQIKHKFVLKSDYINSKLLQKESSFKIVNGAHDR
jgi:hypothetical protein